MLARAEASSSFRNPPIKHLVSVMPPELVNTVVCPNCGTEAPAAAEQCRTCATSLTVDDQERRPGDRSGHRPGDRPRMLDRPLPVLAIIFFAMAIFGIPLLWVSRGFSRPMKIFWSIMATIYTALLLWGFYAVMVYVVSSVIDTLQEF